MRVVRRYSSLLTILVMVGAGALSVIDAEPASAGGSWMHGEWDRYEPGETVTMVGYFGRGQLGWLEDGPFFAHVRPVIDAGPDVMPPTVLTAPARFTDGQRRVLPFGTLSQVRAETTFVLPSDLRRGSTW